MNALDLERGSIARIAFGVVVGSAVLFAVIAVVQWFAGVVA